MASPPVYSEELVAHTHDDGFVATCEREGIAPDEARDEMRAGRLVFFRSRQSEGRETYQPMMIGSRVANKVTALTGLGPNDQDYESTIETLTVITAARPDALIDLTTNDVATTLRPLLREHLDIPVGACLTYDVFTDFKVELTEAALVDRIRATLDTGVDFVLMHLGVNRRLAAHMDESHRIMPTTSRGGGLVARYMKVHDADNPFLTHFDAVLELLREYRVVLDMGDIFRPGCLADAGDGLKVKELELIAEYRIRALEAGVQVFCESGGHMPLDRIPELISSYKEIVGGAPMWLAGPMPIDIGVAFDSVVNALGVATAARHGGDMFASITDNEHYAMPTAPDTANAVRNVRVALAAASVADGNGSAWDQNRRLSEARRKNEWHVQAEHALYPDIANQVFLQHDLLRDGKPCTICGKYCPHIVVGKAQQAARAAGETDGDGDGADGDAAHGDDGGGSVPVELSPGPG